MILFRTNYNDPTLFTVDRCEVSPAGEKIFVTNNSHSKVLTLARDGTVLHTFPDLQDPGGIHVTDLGQVLVWESSVSDILQLDGEGKKKLATLATRKDGLDKVRSVCFKRSTASFIVGQWSSDNILVLRVK